MPPLQAARRNRSPSTCSGPFFFLDSILMKKISPFYCFTARTQCFLASCIKTSKLSRWDWGTRTPVTAREYFPKGLQLSRQWVKDSTDKWRQEGIAKTRTTAGVFPAFSPFRYATQYTLSVLGFTREVVVQVSYWIANNPLKFQKKNFLLHFLLLIQSCELHPFEPLASPASLPVCHIRLLHLIMDQNLSLFMGFLDFWSILWINYWTSLASVEAHV